MKTLFDMRIFHGAAVLGLASLYWLLSSYYALREEFSRTDVLYISIAFISVLIVESILVILVAKFIGRMVALSLAAVFLVGNAFSNNLSMNDQFMTLGPLIIGALLIAGTCVSFLIVRMTADSPNAGRVILTVCGLLAVIPTASNLFVRRIDTKPSAGEISSVVRNVDFVQKPNVYFIGFESMAPPTVLEKYLKLEGPALRDAFERNNFRIFRNMFSEAAPTTSSLHSLLALDSDYLRAAYTAAQGSKNPRPLIAGHLPSPLYEVFKHNGYETNFSYMKSFFGEEGGPHVDRYRYNEAFSVCTFMEPYKVAFAFFGACRLHDQPWWRNSGKVPGADIDFLLANLEETSRRTKPQFYFAHVSPFGHTSGDFTGTSTQLDEFRESYERGIGRAVTYLDRIVEFLKENDPEALLFIFGDHGIWISRTVRFEDDKTFFIQDRLAVMGAFYPKDACASSFDEPISPDFVTTPQVARMLIRCLSGGVDAFDASYEHKFYSYPKERIEDYVYE